VYPFLATKGLLQLTFPDADPSILVLNDSNNRRILVTLALDLGYPDYSPAAQFHVPYERIRSDGELERDCWYQVELAKRATK
jgi:hypothetical protein